MQYCEKGFSQLSFFKNTVMWKWEIGAMIHLLLSSLQEQFFRLLERHSKLFFRCWLPFVPFCVNIIPHFFNDFEVWTPGRPIHDSESLFVCFSIHVCFQCIGSVLGITVLLLTFCQQEIFLMVLHFGSKYVIPVITPSILTY